MAGIPPVFTNAFVFFSIAEAAHKAAEASWAEHVTVRPDGGRVLRPDPEQLSFKQSLIAVVFAGVYLEAILHIEGVRRLGAAFNDRWTYEVKLAKLGAPEDLIAEAQHVRQARNDVVHEKATVPQKMRTAQDEGRRAIAFIFRVSAWLADLEPTEPR